MQHYELHVGAKFCIASRFPEYNMKAAVLCVQFIYATIGETEDRHKSHVIEWFLSRLLVVC